MASFTKFQQFVEDVAHGVHDLETDQLVVALTNSAPVATNEILANLTEVSYTYCSTRNITTTSSLHTTGTYKLILTDLVLTASGGAIGPFRYVTVYNDTPTAPADPLVGFYDYGSSITVNDGETFTCDFDGSGGVLTLA
jgi:hypothetical protein